VIADVLLDEAVSVMAADHGIGQAIMFSATAASALPATANCLIDESNSCFTSLRWDKWVREYGHTCDQIHAIRARSTPQEILDRRLSLGLPRP
jgi:hypothetical protein